MAKNFEWDYAAAGDLLLKSSEIAAFCEEQAERMTRATGVEYIADVHTGKSRVNARGYDFTKNENGQYRNRKRKGGMVVYTQKKLRDDQ